MYLVRILSNLVIICLELTAIAGVAWLGLHHPYMLAAAAAVLALVMGLLLERARLKMELEFYLGRKFPVLSVAGSGLALMEAVIKALLAGVVALITFSGTDPARLFVVSIIFGVCIFAGSSLLRRLSINLGANPSRWGYFRLAAPLGLLYSGAIYLATYFGQLQKPTYAEIAGRLILDTPERLTLDRASELLFLLKQKFDEIVVRVISIAVPPDWAEIAGILVSVNMLTGFAIAVFAVAIADIVQRLETAAG